MKIKVCGMRNAENIKKLSHLAIDFMGFIFYSKSPRYVSTNLSSEIIQLSDQKGMKRVGVFVNESIEKVLEIASNNQLHAIQCHGDESTEYCEVLKNNNLEVIKAFRIHSDFDFSQLNNYQNTCHYYLFDTDSQSYGGTGISFDWNLLSTIQIEKPFFMSGGISIHDIEKINSYDKNNFYAIDINSKFETEPAIKNIELLEQFIHSIK